MGTEIYYFTGTGNSLAVARDLSEKMGGKLIPVVSAVNEQSVHIEADTVGIVFPVYNQCVPYIIKGFIDKADSLRDKYIFAVCTCGGGPSLVGEYLSGYIEQKGGTLAGAFAVRMPYNYISPIFRLKGLLSFTLKEISAEKQNDMFRAWKSKLNDICGYVGAGKTGTLETSSETIERLVNRLNLRETLKKSGWLKIAGYRGQTALPYTESVKLMDYGFKADENCTGCAACGRICPVGNISIKGGRPVWLHKCTQCFACLQWCPKQAIQFGEYTSGRKRYHHPDITVTDMLGQKKS